MIAIAAAGCNPDPVKPAARPPSAHEARFKAGPYIATTKQLSEHEDISTLVLPSSFGPLLDTQCFIYRNLEFKQAVVHCPGERMLDAAAIEQQ